jgi:hypothetical protein
MAILSTLAFALGVLLYLAALAFAPNIDLTPEQRELETLNGLEKSYISLDAAWNKFLRRPDTQLFMKAIDELKAIEDKIKVYDARFTPDPNANFLVGYTGVAIAVATEGFSKVSKASLLAELAVKNMEVDTLGKSLRMECTNTMEHRLLAMRRLRDADPSRLTRDELDEIKDMGPAPGLLTADQHHTEWTAFFRKQKVLGLPLP